MTSASVQDTATSGQMKGLTLPLLCVCKQPRTDLQGRVYDLSKPLVLLSQNILWTSSRLCLRDRGGEGGRIRWVNLSAGWRQQGRWPGQGRWPRRGTVLVRPRHPRSCLKKNCCNALKAERSMSDLLLILGMFNLFWQRMWMDKLKEAGF